jgi:hypothetical protein
VLGQDVQVVREVEELRGKATLEPRHRGGRVRRRDRVDVGEEGAALAAERRVAGDAEAERHVARRDRPAVVPARPAREREADRQRVLGPRPPLGQARAETAVAERVERVAGVGEPVEQLIDDGGGGAGRGERREKRRGLGGRGDHHRAPEIARRRRIAVASTIAAGGQQRCGER